MAPIVPRLGVGLAYQTALRPFIEDSLDQFDYLEIVPDILWTDFGPGHSPRHVDDPGGRRFLTAVAAVKPVVPHSIGLSIGAAHRFDAGHVEQMARWQEWLQFPWHSDHLGFAVADHGFNIGTTMPLVRDAETLAPSGATGAEQDYRSAGAGCASSGSVPSWPTANARCASVGAGEVARALCGLVLNRFPVGSRSDVARWQCCLCSVAISGSSSAFTGTLGGRSGALTLWRSAGAIVLEQNRVRL